MDTFAKLIFIVILAVFHTSSHSATYTPDFGELKLVDGDLHITRGNGTTSLMYPDAGLSKSINVSTSKGNFPFPVEKSFPVEPSKLGKAATRFLKTLPAIGTAVALYDTVCDLTEICVSTEDNGLIYRDGPNYLGSVDNPSSCSLHPYPSNNYVTVDGQLYEYKTFPSTDHGCSSPPKENFSFANNCTVSTQKLSCGYYQPHRRLVSSLPESTERPLTESDWTAAETKLNVKPQQTAEALYNSDAPVPVDASTQSPPVTQQIAQTSTQTKDAQGNLTGTQVATTSVKVEDTSTASNVTYNVTETTIITTYNENNEITSTQTATSDNQPPNKPPESETTLSFDDVPPDDLEQEDVDLDMPDYESWGEGTCPDDVDLGVFGLSISYQPVCDVAVDLRPFFLLLASVTAVYILSGVSTKD